jgi:hypothetical protein
LLEIPNVLFSGQLHIFQFNVGEGRFLLDYRIGGGHKFDAVLEITSKVVCALKANNALRKYKSQFSRLSIVILCGH